MKKKSAHLQKLICSIRTLWVWCNHIWLRVARIHKPAICFPLTNHQQGTFPTHWHRIQSTCELWQWLLEVSGSHSMFCVYFSIHWLQAVQLCEPQSLRPICRTRTGSVSATRETNKSSSQKDFRLHVPSLWTQPKGAWCTLEWLLVIWQLSCHSPILFHLLL